jgi:hypothetical protein
LDGKGKGLDHDLTPQRSGSGERILQPRYREVRDIRTVLEGKTGPSKEEAHRCHELFKRARGVLEPHPYDRRRTRLREEAEGGEAELKRLSTGPALDTRSDLIDLVFLDFAQENKG